MQKKIILSGLLIAAVAYFFLNPEENGLFPKCPFLMLTDFVCPGCGSQRAVHALLHLDFIGAFRYNALLVCSLPVVFVLLFAEARRERCPIFYSRVHRVTFIWIYFGIVVAWWIGRNIFQV